MSLAKKYARELNHKFNLLATWMPNRSLSLGDYGYLKNSEFQYQGNLKDLGVELTDIRTGTPSDLSMTSGKSVTISHKIAGSGSVPGSSLGATDVGLTVQFEKKKGVAFRANGAQSHSLTNLPAILDQLLKHPDWNRDWVVITEVISAESATVLISEEGGTTVDLKAATDVGDKNLNIANAELGFQVNVQGNLGFEMVSQGATTPLFRANQVRTGIFGSETFKSRSTEIPSEADLETQLVSLTIAEYLED